MNPLKQLFVQNKQWAEKIEADNPGFFEGLANQQHPKYLWIGCSDSRVPANEIVGLPPGEMFVHRNVANMVPHTDLNCLAVIQYAVEVLKVEHIIVCGHYGCGGVKAAISNQKFGLIDNWLNNIKDIYDKNETKFQKIENEEERVNLLCELNVKEQVKRVCHTTFVQDAWDEGRSLSIHGLVYGLHDGLLKDLHVCIQGKNEIHNVYRMED